MSRDLYEALQDPDEAEKIGPEAAWLAQLTAAAADLRSWKAGSLAEAELQEGLWADEDDALAEEDGPVVLAASDDTERTFPACYSGAGWQVLLGLSEDGTPYAILTDGPDDFASLTIDGGAHELSIGAEVPLPALEAPPARLRLLDEDGTEHVLSPS